MNICILDSSDTTHILSLSDRRAIHIIKILGKKKGESIKAGSPNGTIGTATIAAIDDTSLTLLYQAESSAPPLRPIHVLLGTARPIQAARIVRDLVSLGVASIQFFPTDLGEKSYTQSNFYRQKEYQSDALQGAEQSGNPRIPEISLVWSRNKILEKIRQQEGSKIICHPDADAPLLSAIPLYQGETVYIAIGTERGWTPTEITEFEEAGFSRRSLGSRILRTETAAISAVSVLLSRLGYL